MSDDIIILPRDDIYFIFSEFYKKISKDFDKALKDLNLEDKKLKVFKEMMINSIDGIHRAILEESMKFEKEIEKEDVVEVKEEVEEKKGKGFWD